MSLLNNYTVRLDRKPKGISTDFSNFQVLSRGDLYSDYTTKLREEVKRLKTQILTQKREYETRHESEIRELKTQFKNDLKANVDIAFEDGRQKGIQEGKKLKEDEIKDIVSQAGKVLSTIQEQRSGMLQKSHEDILNLALSVSRKIMQVEPHINKEVIRKVIVSALEKVIDKSMIKIHLNPKNVEAIEKMMPEILSKFRELPKIDLESDNLVGAGGCIVETRSGFIDARLETQIQKLSSKMFLSLSKKE